MIADSPERLRDDLADRLKHLADGGRLCVVEIGGQGITTIIVGIDRTGLLRSGRPRTIDWDALADLDLDRIVPVGHGVVLVCTTPNWPIQDKALETLRQRHPDATTARVPDTDVVATVSELVAAAPLRTKLELVVAYLNPDSGIVGIRPYTLFPVGARAGQEQQVTISCTHAVDAGTVLAVVTWYDGRPHHVSTDSVRLRPGTYELRATLAESGRVTFTDPPGVTADPRSWSELLAALPERVTPTVSDVDLVCCVDLSAHGFGARRELVAGCIELLGSEYSEPGRFRAAVIGYGDHIFNTRATPVGDRAEDKVVFGSRLASPADALDHLYALDTVEPGPWPSAPIEDALARIAPRIGRIPANRKVILLTVGDRPPHPSREGADGALPCPREYDWQRLLRQIESREGLVSLAVLDSGEHAGPAWRRLGRSGLHHLTRTDPERLAIAAGVIVPPHRRLPFPLLDNEG